MHFEESVLQRAHVTQTEVDGVPTFFTDTGGVFSAGLVFRCGFVDESLQTRGITHLLEHLAFHGLHSPTLSVNGSVGSTTIWFQAQGDEREVVNFLNTLTSRLSDPPFSRLVRERAVLEIESDQAGPWDELLRTRYGPQGYGLLGYAQLGLPHITEELLQGHAARHFTRQNCAAYFTAPPPSNLNLHLPDGKPRYAPDPQIDLIGPGPSYIVDYDDAVVFHSATARSVAQSLVAFALDDRLKKRLRFDLGLAYSPTVDYMPSSPQGTSVYGMLDSDAARVDRATQEAAEIIFGLTSGSSPVTDKELTAFRTVAALADEASATSRHMAGYFCDRHVQGLDIPSDLLGEIDALTSEDLITAGHNMVDKMIVSVPEGSTQHFDGWRRVIPGQSDGLSGTIFVARDSPRHGTLIVSADSVGVYEDCATFHAARKVAGVITYANGARVLLGHDSARVTVVPSQWHKGADAVRLIDQTFSTLLIPVDKDGPEYDPEPVISRMDAFWLAWSAVLAIIAAFSFPRLAILPIIYIVGFIAIRSFTFSRKVHRSGQPGSRFT